MSALGIHHLRQSLNMSNLGICSDSNIVSRADAPYKPALMGSIFTRRLVTLPRDCISLTSLVPFPELWVIGGYWLREVRRPFSAHISTSEPASDGRFERSVTGDAGGSHCIDFLPAYLCLKLDIMR